MRIGRALVIVLIYLTTCSRATTGTVGVRDAWSRAVPGMSHSGAVFMVIENHGSTGEVLIGVETDICEAVELHESVMEGDVMKMRPVTGGGINIPAGEDLELKPGGMHVMLIGLQEALVAGEAFDLTLEFQQAGKIRVEVAVREAGASEMGG